MPSLPFRVFTNAACTRSRGRQISVAQQVPKTDPSEVSILANFKLPFRCAGIRQSRRRLSRHSESTGFGRSRAKLEFFCASPLRLRSAAYHISKSRAKFWGVCQIHYFAICFRACVAADLTKASASSRSKCSSCVFSEFSRRMPADFEAHRWTLESPSVSNRLSIVVNYSQRTASQSVAARCRNCMWCCAGKACRGAGLSNLLLPGSCGQRICVVYFVGHKPRKVGV